MRKVGDSLIFKDRSEAGQLLASKLTPLPWRGGVILAIPRGGVPVGFEVSKKLGLPLNVILVRKLGAPNQPELAFGAVAEEGTKIFDYALMYSLDINLAYIKTVMVKERQVIEKRKKLFRNGNPIPNLTGKTAIIVDDGLATGLTVKAAVAAVKQKNPNKIIVAIPVAPREVIFELLSLVDTVKCLSSPENFNAVSNWYENFPQVTDKEVLKILESAKSN